MTEMSTGNITLQTEYITYTCTIDHFEQTKYLPFSQNLRTSSSIVRPECTK